MTISLRQRVRSLSADSCLLIVFLLVAAMSLGLITLVSEVMEGNFRAFDRWLLIGLRTMDDPSVPIGPAWLGRFMREVTALGGGEVLTLVVVVATGYLFARRNFALGLLVAGSALAGGLANRLLKYAFARERPDLVPHLIDVQATSFPSGHAMNAAIVYLTLGALLARAEPRRPVRIYLLSVAIGLTTIIGASRIYLGVHWPSDVVAGWCVGGSWAVLCSLVARSLDGEGRVTVAAPVPDTPDDRK